MQTRNVGRWGWAWGWAWGPGWRTLAVLVVLAALPGSIRSADAQTVRPPVREIDVLIALLDADVPTALWVAVDEPLDRYLSSIEARARIWATQPPLTRVVERPAEIDVLRREQRRRSEWLLAEQRTLISELQAGLLAAEAAAAPGRDDESSDDGRWANDVALWLQARLADRLVAATRDGMVVSTPIPLPLAMRLAPSERRAAREAMRPHLRSYVDAAEAFHEAHLRNSPARPPTNEHGQVLDGFVADTIDEVMAERDRRASLAAALTRASASLHAAVLESIGSHGPDSRRATVLAAMFERLEPNAHLARNARPFWHLAPKVAGIDDSTRQRLEELRDEIEAKLASTHEEVVARLASFTASEYGATLRLPGDGSAPPFYEEFQTWERAWSSSAEELLGDRLRQVRRVGWSAPDAVEALGELMDERSTERALAIDDPHWQYRTIGTRRPSVARWRSVVDAEPASVELRRRLGEVADDDGESLAALLAAIDAHADRWRERVAPAQAELRTRIDEFVRLTATDDPTRLIATIASSLDSLRQSIDDLEATLTAAVRGAARDRFAAERWILDRAIELHAPPDATDTRIWLPRMVMPSTIDEVIARAGLAPDEADAARGVGYVHADQLIAAARMRQAWFEALRIGRNRRQTHFMVMMRTRGGSGSDVRAAAAAELDAIARRLGFATMPDPDRAIVDAWEAILADWSTVLPGRAEALRTAWLGGVIPDMANEALAVGPMLVRLSRRLADDDLRADPHTDPRSAALAALAERHDADRARLVAATAEELIRHPQWMERWSLDPAFRGPPNPRASAEDEFDRADRDQGVRTIRAAIAIVGGDEALADAAMISLLLRAHAERWL